MRLKKEGQRRQVTAASPCNSDIESTGRERGEGGWVSRTPLVRCLHRCQYFKVGAQPARRNQNLDMIRTTSRVMLVCMFVLADLTRLHRTNAHVVVLHRPTTRQTAPAIPTRFLRSPRRTSEARGKPYQSLRTLEARRHVSRCVLSGSDGSRGDDGIDLEKAMANARANLGEGRSPGAGLESAYDQADAAYADLILTSVDDQGVDLTDQVRKSCQQQRADTKLSLLGCCDTADGQTQTASCGLVS